LDDGNHAQDLAARVHRDIGPDLMYKVVIRPGRCATRVIRRESRRVRSNLRS